MSTKRIIEIFLIVFLIGGAITVNIYYRAQNKLVTEPLVVTPPAVEAPSVENKTSPDTIEELPPINTKKLYSFLQEVSEPFRGQTITVYITAQIPPHDTIIELTSQFTHATGIEVKFIQTQYPLSLDRFLDALKSGTADVIDQEGMWRAAYEPLLEDLRDFKHLEYPGYNIDDFFDLGGIEGFITEDGKISGFPQFASIPLFNYIPQYFIDAGLVDENGEPRIPSNLDEYYEFAKKMTIDTDGDGEIDVWGTILSGARTGIHDEINTYYWASTPQAETFNEKLQPVFNNPDYVKILETYSKIWTEGYAHPDSPITEVGPAIVALNKKEVAFAWHWSLFLPFTMDPLGELKPSNKY